MSKHVIVIGDGGWGTALAMILIKNGHDVTLWGPFQDYLDEMATTRENTRYLPGHPLPNRLAFTNDPAVASSADAAVLVVPSKFYGPVLESFYDHLPKDALVVSRPAKFSGGTISPCSPDPATRKKSPAASPQP